MGQIVAIDYPLTLQAGATWSVTFKVRDKQTGDPVPLTGWSARMQIRSAINSNTVLLSADTTDVAPSPRMVVDAAGGAVSFWVEAVDTATLAPGGVRTPLVYGIELFKTDGGVEKVVPFVQSTLTAAAEVVRS